ncbi:MULTISPECIES: precorrin-6Y C5,15-methyltransferase (decarboxylating) subunit CbiT [unclassified Clostridium]|uniref:precorrin-6Y C5,15-methyltransferase (decarboxylating) subunit CbiT n=1 Tax=Clostridium TaxID=1485 RepID=UPI001C8BCBCF|nr:MULTISPECIES: precorrin-6Y C5,15-methyltransferase (decarboxylating) subunit CbiT [unclassified Clostridium]MBX9138578.1 precorrin-6Y C5,15-methyltransferase (decarboxylating) subunit CbiT [Clostridium sp. K12(2020)]MBX9145350.1 precorrin-6Y C5,15-methyltransferase (decarboxylating) subunit CbiT [Clostridium sp. K13]MDU2289999.1 precorrin-6Y C5,15-methyltransferase (decarboxylating) subunit CbiT [Clostridium celatum]MDU4325118.1 precorrin-6Y C5,15-methyltransferase (decarboxylating) subunit 
MILIKDSEFIRGNCPMTKEDIRALSIWKMNLKEGAIVLDIGSGTGTITVQASKIARKGIIYAIEKDNEAIITTKNNLEKFKCNNVVLDEGEALDILKTYKDENKRFDSIFIGGSGGNLEEIISISNDLLQSEGTIVMNFITLDNAYKAIETIKKLNYQVDISQVNISKNRGESYMMIANNPIYIVQGIRSVK